MKLGIWGEEAAAKYLMKKGYYILEKNFRCPLGEIDIIAGKDKKLIFVEVKTRQSMNYGLPCESITLVKKHHITRTARYYIATNQMDAMELQFDVIEILKRERKAYIRHTECAF